MSNPNAGRQFVTSLKDTGLSLFVVSIVGGIVSLIVVVFRSFIRVRDRNFSLDDGLMVAGLVVYLVDVALACVGVMSGLGLRNAELSNSMLVDSIKYLMLWMLHYVIALCLVKSSICFTMLRIASSVNKMRITIYSLLAFIIGTFVATFIGILLLCSPVEANWDASLITSGRGHCSSVSSMLGLSYFSTASTIATDLACAILPAVILWETQMKTSVKIMVAIFLSFGSFASISTMIRTPYIDNYNRPTEDLAYHIANIPLWSNVETAIGLIAGSMPALRQFIVRKSHHNSKSHVSEEQGSVGLVTIGGTGGTKSKSSKAIKSTFEANERQGDWERLEDNGSDKASDKGSTVPIRGIRKDVSYEVDSATLHGNEKNGFTNRK